MNRNATIILSINGKPGLYRLMGQTRAGLFVRHITEGKQSVVPPFKVSALDDIVIYTDAGQLALPEVLAKIRAAGPGRPDPKTADKEALKAYFGQVLPGYDADRFHPSHMKKVLQWYGLLERAGLLDEVVPDEKPADGEAEQKNV